MQSPAPSATRSPRLLSLSVARLAGNGLFRFVYPFLGVVALDVGLGEGAEGLLISGLAVGGFLVPAATRMVAGQQDAPRRQTTAGLLTLAAGTAVLALLAPLAASVAATLGIATALLAMVVLGLAKPLLDVGSMAYVSARIPYARRGRALSIMELTWAGGLLLLAPLRALADATSWQLSLLLLGGAALASVPVLRSSLDADELQPGHAAVVPDGHAAGRGDETESDELPPESRRSSRVLFLVVVVAIFVALEATFGVIGLWLEDAPAVTLAWTGNVVGAVTLATGVGAIGELCGSAFVVGLSDRLGKPATAIVGLVACAVGFTITGTADGIGGQVLGLAIGLFGTESSIVAGIALASEVAPRRRSAFLGQMVAASSVSRAVMGAAAPLLLLNRGIAANTTISAVAALTAVLGIGVLIVREPRLRA